MPYAAAHGGGAVGRKTRLRNYGGRLLLIFDVELKSVTLEIVRTLKEDRSRVKTCSVKAYEILTRMTANWGLGGVRYKTPRKSSTLREDWAIITTVTAAAVKIVMMAAEVAVRRTADELLWRGTIFLRRGTCGRQRCV